MGNHQQQPTHSFAAIIQQIVFRNVFCIPNILWIFIFINQYHPHSQCVSVLEGGDSEGEYLWGGIPIGEIR